MNNKTSETKEDYKSVIFSGCSIESNGISICNLNNYTSRAVVRAARYQVWSDKHRIYEMYHNIDDAVNTFLELRNRGY